MYHYPASVSFDEETGTWEILLRDFEAPPSVALSEEDIELAATEGLTAAIGDSIDLRRLIPSPSARAGADRGSRPGQGRRRSGRGHG